MKTHPNACSTKPPRSVENQHARNPGRHPASPSGQTPRVRKFVLAMLSTALFISGSAAVVAEVRNSAPEVNTTSNTPSHSASTVPSRHLQEQNTTEPVAVNQPVSAQRPNIIFVMADDQGWEDVSISQQLSPTETFVGTLHTPELEEMARSSMTFSRFYAASPLCSSTRAAFLIGRQHHRTDVKQANDGHMRNAEITMAELAQMQGYATGHFGKWHLGGMDREIYQLDGRRGGSGRPESYQDYTTPWDHGFEVGFSVERAINTFNPYISQSSNADRYWTARGVPIPSPRYGDTDNRDDPIDPRLVGDSSEVIMNQTIDFIDSADGRPFLAVVWLATPHHRITHPAEGGRVAQYVAAIQGIDTQVGRLRDHLAAQGLTENTLLVYTSDNGASNSSPRPAETNPLQGVKGWTYEGGIRVPGLIEWPGHVPAGVNTNTVGGVIDLLPTMLDLWQMEMPDDRQLDGESLRPIWEGATERQGSMPFWCSYRGEAGFATIDTTGQFKLRGQELFDLWNDPTETTDCSADHPEVKARLHAEYEQWKEDVVASRLGGDYQWYVADCSGAELRHELNLVEEVNLQAGRHYLTDLRDGQRERAEAELFSERQFATLQEPISPVPSAATEVATAEVARGTTVHSFLLHFDPQAEATTEVTLTFDNPVLAVIGQVEQLDATDALAYAPPRFSGVAIGDTPGESIARSGLEEGDSYSLSDDARTITFQLNAEQGHADQVRIVTAIE